MEREIAENFLKKIGFDIESEEVKETILNPIIETIKNRCCNPIYPGPNESLAVSVVTPKTAALAFDRVYRIPVMNEPVPEEIGFYGATFPEVAWHSTALLYLTAKQLDIETDINPFESKANDTSDKSENEKDSLRLICSEFPKIFKQSPTFFYHSQSNYLKDFPVGKEQILLSAISNIALVDEEKLEWEQVIEFRKDKISSVKYKRFMRWVDTELVNKSQSQIIDEIAIKLDDYNWTLKKHGLQTAVGTVSSLLDPKFLGSASAATIATGFTAGGLWAALTSLSLVLGKTAITFGTKYIDGTNESRKENYEIAYINEIKKKLS